MKLSLIAVTATAIALAGCGHSVQTTSGRDYLSSYPAPADFHPSAELDERVRQVAAVEPTLRFPARIGLARISNGDLSPIPQAEAEAWMAAAEDLGPRFGEYLPISPLVAEMFAEKDSSRYQPHIRAVLEKIRLGAARQHVDAVLVYEVYGTSASRANPLSVADVTIIGAFLLPGRSLEAAGHARALLLDVRNGYPYGTAEATVDRSSLATAWAASDSRSAMVEQAKTAAAIALVDEVEVMIEELWAELVRRDRSGAGAGR